MLLSRLKKSVVKTSYLKMLYLKYIFLCFFPFFLASKTTKKLTPEHISSFLVTEKANELFEKMNDNERIGQMLVVATGKLGKPKKDVLEIIKKYHIGGILLLNGSKKEFQGYVKEFDKITQNKNGIPILYSADAEPSLINFKIKGLPYIKPTSTIKDSTDCYNIGQQISKELLEIGIRHNYAPVCDMSTKNIAIGNRSFGSDEKRVMDMSLVFINASHNNNVIATAKHFPGHGYVKGDTHEQLVFIDGELKELSVYKHLIENFTLSIMVGHIAIKNNEKYNTNGFPATCSRVIVTDLLRKQMNFNGLIVTDAMNMGAVKKLKDAPFLAAKAGNDMILMVEDEGKFVADVLAEMSVNAEFKTQIYESVKRILRYKVALGII